MYQTEEKRLDSRLENGNGTIINEVFNRGNAHETKNMLCIWLWLVCM